MKNPLSSLLVRESRSPVSLGADRLAMLTLHYELDLENKNCRGGIRSVQWPPGSSEEIAKLSEHLKLLLKRQVLEN